MKGMVIYTPGFIPVERRHVGANLRVRPVCSPGMFALYVRPVYSPCVFALPRAPRWEKGAHTGAPLHLKQIFLSINKLFNY
jgi:hypothetical protein